MSLISACCNRPPVKIEYTPKGEIFHLENGLRCYITGNKDSKAAIIHNYDIFNYHPNCFHAADIFAEAGFRVIVPDMFRDHPVKVEMLGDRQKIMARLIEVGMFPHLESDYKAVKAHLNGEGFDKIFLTGYCWGAKMCMALTASDSSYLGGALFHPSLLDENDFKNAQAPMIIQPSKEDPDFTEWYQELTAKPFGKYCYLQVYDDMVHGFTSGRGEWYIPHVKKRADEAFNNAIRGFNRILADRA
ncbi:putative AIM2 family protein [Smittium mucronatum]|uniref:Putative AIM2 family protein n=1 Tax=Smittium mucronatum TaxID=133383 RepID=A0A1R0GRC1_9FUNG|nr:putative AIM2 family protein [Smittium mucronatum]